MGLAFYSPFYARENFYTPRKTRPHPDPILQTLRRTDSGVGKSREKELYREDIICPLDGKPCEKDCPDRYIDHPGGGCFLTTAQELGAKIIDLGGGDVGMMFTPNGKKVKI
mgnify:CR=1 FL=1